MPGIRLGVVIAVCLQFGHSGDSPSSVAVMSGSPVSVVLLLKCPLFLASMFVMLPRPRSSRTRGKESSCLGST